MPISWKRRLKRTGSLLALILVLAAIIMFIPQEYPVPGDSGTIISRLAGKDLFDFVEWTGDAWLEKAGQISVPVQDYLSNAQRSQFVLDYTQLVNDWWSLEWQVRQIYSDASVKEPEAQTKELRAKRDAVRAEIERQPVFWCIELALYEIFGLFGNRCGSTQIWGVCRRRSPLHTPQIWGSSR